MKAQEQGLARIELTYEETYSQAHKIIKRSRDLTHMMMEKDFIEKPPSNLD